MTGQVLIFGFSFRGTLERVCLTVSIIGATRCTAREGCMTLRSRTPFTRCLSYVYNLQL